MTQTLTETLAVPIAAMTSGLILGVALWVLTLFNGADEKGGD